MICTKKNKAKGAVISDHSLCADHKQVFVRSFQGIVFVAFADAELSVGHIQAVLENWINVASVFVGEHVVFVECHRIVVSVESVVFAEQLRKAEAFGRDGFVELEVECLLLCCVGRVDDDFAQIVRVKGVVVHEIEAIVHSFMVITIYFLLKIVFAWTVVTLWFYGDFLFGCAKRQCCDVAFQR